MGIAIDCAFAPLAQDLVVLQAQGPIADRSREVEHLGASDIGVVALRQLYQHELSTLSQSCPLRKFRRPKVLLPLPESS